MATATPVGGIQGRVSSININPLFSFTITALRKLSGMGIRYEFYNRY